MERAETEEAETDVLVQVSMAVEGRFAVVQVERAEVLQPHGFIEIVQCLFENCGFPQVVARCVDVAGIDAHADSFLVVHQGDDVAQVFKGRANDVAAACHGFEDRRDGFGGFMRSIESLGYAGDGGGSGMAAGPAGVEVVESDAEGFAADEIVKEGIVGLCGFFCIFLSEIDKIGAVR